MALKYLRLNKNIVPIILYPKSQNYLNKEIIKKMDEIIKKYGYIYYRKKIKLSERGMINLIKEIYRGESWIGGVYPINKFSKQKFNDIYDSNYLEIILVNIDNINLLRETKNDFRKLFHLKENLLHISDNCMDSFRICSSLLNENSLNYLNNAETDLYFQSERMNKLLNYFNLLQKENTDYCITSSIILEMYGLRNAKDIDYLHIENKDINLPLFGCHTGKWLDYYHICKEEIIYNPKYHFYFNGFKFASLEVIKKMKQKRNEEKDKIDIKLINSII